MATIRKGDENMRPTLTAPMIIVMEMVTHLGRTYPCPVTELPADIKLDELARKVAENTLECKRSQITAIYEIDPVAGTVRDITHAVMQCADEIPDEDEQNWREDRDHERVERMALR